MKFPPRLHEYAGRVLLTLGALLCVAPVALAGDLWKPVEPSQLALKQPVVERDADAEAIFWEVRVADEIEGGGPRTVLDHYIRIKIFTERGREAQSRIDIPFGKVFGREIKINDIAGRTIKADGSIIELKKEDIFERMVVKLNGAKIKAKSFAMPGVEPGAIIEYRWREVRGDSLTMYERLEFSREIPVQLVRYYIKPLSLHGFPYGMRIQFFHGEMTDFQKEKDGFYSTSMTNVPAFHEEPRMPPHYAVRPWMLVYYSEDKKLQPERFWKEYGKQIYEGTKANLKVNDEVRKAATEIIGDASTPEQKLERLFDYCRIKIKNIYDDASGFTAADRAKMKENKTPADTLKRGMGTGGDIDLLFAALATAAGFEARLANLSDRSDFFFDKNFPDPYFIRASNIAVKVGDQWRFFDPASVYVPFGMLRWQEEGQEALLSDPKDPVFVTTTMSQPERSLQKRTARLRLSDDGTLEGEVRIEYTGHTAAEMKELNDDDSPAEREETLKQAVKSRLSTAELTDIHIENVTDPVKPFVYTYHVRVPGYAQRTGKRLFIQPAFFQYNIGPLFSTSERKHEIYFHYPWSEEDDVEIALPEGYALDNPNSPAPISANELSKYDVKLVATKDGRTLIYHRKFFFGGGATDMFRMRFAPSTYPILKNYFDVIHKQDGHTISLKQGAATAQTGTTKPN
jgi:hypothetical protein